MVEKFIDELRRTCEEIIVQDKSVWVITGDIFHTRTPSNAARKAFAAIISKAMSHGVIVVILLGNHDIQTTLGGEDSLAELAELPVKNLHIIQNPCILSLEIKNKKIQFLCQPWRKSAAEVVESSEALKKQLDPNAFGRFYLGHFTVEGAVVGAEKLFELQSGESVPTSAISDPLIDYAFIGHIHKAQVLGPRAAYIGSMDRVDFSERNEPKGRMDFTISPERGLSVIHVEGTPQKYVQYDIDLTVPGSLEKAFMVPCDGAVVKVRVKCTDEQKKTFDHLDLMDRLKAAKFVMPVAFEIQKADDVHRNNGIGHEVHWSDALKTWLDRQPVSPELKVAVIAASKELFQEASEVKP
jgi:exonuclease SbcD